MLQVLDGLRVLIPLLSTNLGSSLWEVDIASSNRHYPLFESFIIRSLEFFDLDLYSSVTVLQQSKKSWALIPLVDKSHGFDTLGWFISPQSNTLESSINPIIKGICINPKNNRFQSIQPKIHALSKKTIDTTEDIGNQRVRKTKAINGNDKHKDFNVVRSI